MLTSARGKLKKLNNKASAIITVVITMLFVMALGGALLFAAYTGYSIEITQRGDKANFYDASSAMDDMRLGIQTLLSDSITSAYTDALSTYVGDHEANYDPQTYFNDKIVEQLLLKTVTVNGAPVKVFTSSVADGKTVISGYNAVAMKALIDSSVLADSAVTITVTGDGSVSRNSSDGELKSIAMKTLAVKFVKNGYESNISSDIILTLPHFFVTTSVTSGANNYAIIANNGLIHSVGGASTINGSVFAGNGGITVSGNGNSLAFPSGDLICKGPLLVDNSGAFTFNCVNNELWVKEITVGPSARITLNGNVYVSDDLNVSGNGAAVTLKNSYFGFGDSTSSSSDSSSILVNGRSCNLDISGLNKLSLAGIGFIDISGQTLSDAASAAYDTPIKMGESLSFKSNQLAYLVPLKCISNYASNPCVFESGATTQQITPSIDKTTVLWGTGADAKSLSYYIDSGKGEIKALYKNLGDGMKIAYVFLVFSEKSYANEYFKAYFAADPDKIQQYLSLYMTLSDKADNAKINAAGNTFYMDDNSTATTADDKLTLEPASDQVWAEGAQLLYNKKQSQYPVLVNEVELAKLGTAPLEFVNNAGEVVAVVCNGNYTYDGTKNTIRLIIASGNVIISSAYTGMIVTGNNLTVNSSVEGTPVDNDVLSSSCTVGGVTYTLPDFMNNVMQAGGTSSTTGDFWDLDALVYYENWTKG
ncbi:MAG: hypothetical protein EOM51_00525 [Clostridia bacterium]|nr:hypothetical protein [Clostridia bacterium]